MSCAKEMALLALLEKTGYDMVQENGQRKYGGPPPGTTRPAGWNPVIHSFAASLTDAAPFRVGGAGAAAGLRDLRGEGSPRHVRGRAGAAVRERRQDLRVPAHDGVQRRESRLRLRHVHQQVTRSEPSRTAPAQNHKAETAVLFQGGGRQGHPDAGRVRGPTREVHRSVRESGQLPPLHRLHPQRPQEGGDPGGDEEGERFWKENTCRCDSRGRCRCFPADLQTMRRRKTHVNFLFIVCV